MLVGISTSDIISSVALSCTSGKARNWGGIVELDTKRIDSCYGERMLRLSLRGLRCLGPLRSQSRLACSGDLSALPSPTRTHCNFLFSEHTKISFELPHMMRVSVISALLRIQS